MSLGIGKSSQKSSSKPVDTTPAEFQALRDPFAQAISGLWGTGTGGGVSGVPSFTGTTGQPMAASIGGAETDILTNLLSQIGARQPLLDQTIAGEFLPGGAQSNPFLQATIEAAQRPTLQGLEEVLSRTLPGRFTQSGQFTQPQGSSAFDRAAAIATRGAADAAGDIATKIAFGSQEAERGRQQEAIQLSQAEVQTTINNLQAQGLPRLIQDLGLERGQQEFQARIQALLQALQIATGAPLSQQGTVAKGSGSSTQAQFGFGTKQETG